MSAAPDLNREFPSSDRAEAALLGVILLNGSLIWQARQIVRAEWFYADAHKALFRVFSYLTDRGQALDIVTVGEELQRRGELEGVGGITYIAGLISGMPRLENLEFYARIVKDKALLRALVQYGNATQADALEPEEEPADVLRKAQHRLTQIAAAAMGAPDDTAASIAEDFQRDIENPDTPRGIPTGIRELDRITSGLWPGDLWYLAAYTSVGKTSLAVMIAIHLASAGHYVDYLSYEMSQKRVLARIISAGWQVDLMHLRSGRLTSDELIRYREALDWLKGAPLRIVNASGMTTTELRARAHRYKAEGKLHAMVTDYIGLIPSSGRHSNRANEVAAISRDLKTIAGETEVPNLCLAQINRDGAKSSTEPELWWLRDSGGQENDADVVAFLMRDKDSTSGGLYVKKQRDGALGEVPLLFTPQFARYAEPGVRPYVAH